MPQVIYDFYKLLGSKYSNAPSNLDSLHGKASYLAKFDNGIYREAFSWNSDFTEKYKISENTNNLGSSTIFDVRTSLDNMFLMNSIAFSGGNLYTNINNVAKASNFAKNSLFTNSIIGSKITINNCDGKEIEVASPDIIQITSINVTELVISGNLNISENYVISPSSGNTVNISYNSNTPVFLDETFKIGTGISSTTTINLSNIGGFSFKDLDIRDYTPSTFHIGTLSVSDTESVDVTVDTISSNEDKDYYTIDNISKANIISNSGTYYGLTSSTTSDNYPAFTYTNSVAKIEYESEKYYLLIDSDNVNEIDQLATDTNILGFIPSGSTVVFDEVSYSDPRIEHKDTDSYCMYCPNISAVSS